MTQAAKPAKQTIGQFRRAVDTLNWSRNDLSGATSSEFVQMDVKHRLERHITTVREMMPQVGARFHEDVAYAERSIESAVKCIGYWEGKVAGAKAAQARREAEQATSTIIPTRTTLTLVHSVH